MNKSLFPAMADVYLSPGELFRSHANVKKWSWFGLVLIIGFQCLASVLLFSNMSTESIVEQLLEESATDLSARDFADARSALMEVADSMLTINLLTIVAGFLLILSILALYAMLVGNRGKRTRSYWEWFAFCIWITMPLLISSLGLIALIMMTQKHDLQLSSLAYSSLNQLVLGLSPGDRWYGWAKGFDLTYLWCVGLGAIGFYTLSGYSRFMSFVLAALPLVFIFGIWALLV